MWGSLNRELHFLIINRECCKSVHRDCVKTLKWRKIEFIKNVWFQRVAVAVVESMNSSNWYCNLNFTWTTDALVTIITLSSAASITYSSSLMLHFPKVFSNSFLKKEFKVGHFKACSFLYVILWLLTSGKKRKSSISNRKNNPSS